MAEKEKEKSEEKKTLGDHVTIWVGILGTVITLSLTIWNEMTKQEIEQKSEKVQEIDQRLKERAESREEDKQRIERYKWVFGLLDNYSEKDERKKSLTVSMAQLALSKDEAEKLFAGLQVGPNKELQAVGQAGLKVVQNDQVAILVSRMNAGSADVRKNAVQTLLHDYKSSSQAIGLALGMFEGEKLDGLSPSAIINGLFYLGRTDPSAWDHQQAESGRRLASTLETKGIGPEAKKELDQFKKFLNTLP